MKQTIINKLSWVLVLIFGFNPLIFSQKKATLWNVDIRQTKNYTVNNINFHTYYNLPQTSVLNRMEYENNLIDHFYHKAIVSKKQGAIDSMSNNLKRYVSLIENKYGNRDTHFIRAVINSTIELDTVSLTNTFIKELQVCYLNYKNGLTPIEDIYLYWKLLDYYNDALYTAGDYQGSLMLLTEVVHYNTVHKLFNQFYPAYFLFFKGYLHQYFNQLPQADSCYMESKLQFENEVNGIYTNEYSELLRQMADFYKTIDYYYTIEKISLYRIHCMDSLLGKNHINSINPKINLANAYYYLNEYNQAKQAFQSVFTTFNSLPSYYSLTYEYGNTLYYFANFLIDRDQLTEALPYLYLCDSLLAREPSLGNKKKRFIAMSLSQIYFKEGKLMEAKKYLIQSLESITKNFGPDQRDSKRIIKMLAMVEFFLNKDKINFTNPYLIKSLEIYYDEINDVKYFMTFQELEVFLNDASYYLDILFSSLKENDKSNLSALAYNCRLILKGFVSNSIIKIHNLPQTDDFPETNDTSTAELNSKNPSHKETLNSLENKQVNKSVRNNTLEKNLNQSSNNFSTEIQPGSMEEIKSILTEKEVCIEFVYFNKKVSIDSTCPTYGALILKKNDTFPEFITFQSNQLYSLLHEVGNKNNFQHINSVYQNSELSTLLWKTLMPHLNGITTIYCSLDNNLHKVNINALLVDNDSIANDLFDIVLLNSTRDVLKIKQKHNPVTHPKEALVIGNICFNSALNRVVKSNIKIQGSSPIFKKVSSSSKSLPKWKPLVYSEQEIKSITKSLYQSDYIVKELTQNNALEQYLKKYCYGDKSMLSPHIIHFSTHGYFIRQYREDNKKICNCGLDVKSSYFDSPNCGLILSGVNNISIDNTSPNSNDDGILTATEIAQLNLNNTELVVLSACNSGLGDIHSTEGVYGLGRAFKIAGVNKIIMTLWQVPDYQTMELITLFYHNLLKRNLCPRKALHEAQKTMRLKKYEPYYWAGFIIVE